jgi:hypothetical protein
MAPDERADAAKSHPSKALVVNSAVVHGRRSNLPREICRSDSLYDNHKVFLQLRLRLVEMNNSTL